MKLQFSKEAKIICGVLLLQLIGFHLISRDETPPFARPLSEFPSQIGKWRLIQEGVIEDRVQEVLRADDLLTRFYQAPGTPSLNLYVAYFLSQRAGQAPHSPKNCLPGSGWVPSVSGKIQIPITGSANALDVNRYIVQKGERKSLVLYWYQSHGRSVASEYSAKIYLVLDSLRYNRSDTALVRVLVPIVGDQVDSASDIAIRFIQEMYGPLTTGFPQFQNI